VARPLLSNLMPIALALLLFGALGVDARASELVGHVYMQTNETQNRIMHFGRNADGQLKLFESIPTGGAGSGVFKPISGQESAPNAFEGAGSVILAESNTLLFTTNGDDNSVTSFRVSPDGKLTVIDRQPTGKPVTARSGTVKSLAYRPQSRTLYVLHAFGPNHLRSYTVTEGGKLKLNPERQSVNTATKTDRVATQAVLSPDGRFLLINILFDVVQQPIRMGRQIWSWRTPPTQTGS